LEGKEMNELIQQENRKIAIAGGMPLSQTNRMKEVEKLVSRLGATLTTAIELIAGKRHEIELHERGSLNSKPKIIPLEKLLEIIYFLNDVNKRCINEYSLYESFIIEIYYDYLSKEYKHHKICRIDNIKEMYYEEARDCFIIVQKKAKHEGMETIFITNSGAIY
jgi:hypothetical protein